MKMNRIQLSSNTYNLVYIENMYNQCNFIIQAFLRKLDSTIIQTIDLSLLTQLLSSLGSKIRHILEDYRRHMLHYLSTQEQISSKIKAPLEESIQAIISCLEPLIKLQIESETIEYDSIIREFRLVV